MDTLQTSISAGRRERNQADPEHPRVLTVIKLGINDAPQPEQLSWEQELRYYGALGIVSNAITYVVNRPHNHESIDVLFSARRDILDAILALTKPLPNGTSS
jgi:hypothetical protein